MLTGNVMHVAEFEDALLAELAPRETVGDVERWLLLHDALWREKSITGDPVLSGLPASDGFILAVGDLVQQIKLGLIGSKRLNSIKGFAPGKEEWIKSLFFRYEQSLRRAGLFDSADVRIALVEKLSRLKSPPASIARFDEIHFHDIYHFTPFRFELIYLLGRMKKIVLHFPLPDERRKAFGFVENDIQKFQSLGEDSGYIELAFDEPAPGEPSPLERFSLSIFDEEKRQAGSGSPVVMLKNSGRYREIEEVAERILALKGEREWSDFCLVFRDLEQYGAITEDVFRRAGIPLYLRRGIPVRENSHVRILLSVFNAIETDYERDEILKIASSGYFDFLPPSLAPYDLEALVMEAGIINGPLSVWKKKLAKVRARARKVRGAVAGLDRLLKLVGALEKLSRARRAESCVGAFESVLKMMRPKPIRLADPFSLRDSYCRGRFEAVIGEVKEALHRQGLKNAAFSWTDLRRLLLNSLGNVHTPAWSGRNHVYALNVHELAGRRFPYIFVCGLHEGEFPRHAQVGHILTESEKRKFNVLHAQTVLAGSPKARGRQVFGRLGESWEEESFLFYLASRSASSGITLSYSSYELNGEELRRSTFLDDVLTVFPDTKEEIMPAVALEKDYHRQLDAGAREAKLLRDLFRPACEAGPLRDYFQRLASRPAEGRSFLLACERSRTELERESFYSEFQREIRAEKATRYTGMINPAEAGALTAYLDKVVGYAFSPTSLEKYANCPFRYFVEKVLECAPRRLPRPDSERTVQGSVIHEIVERYYSKVRRNPDKPALPPPDRALEVMEEIARDVFDKWEKGGQTGDERLWEITRAQINASLSLFIQNEQEVFRQAPFAVIGTEFEFGPGKRPVTLEHGDRDLNLTGQIDRVDYLPGQKLVRVIDYKHSANISRYSRLLNPELFCIESFQVPVYLFAVLSWLVSDEKMPAPEGGFGAYYSLKKEPKLTKRNESPSMFLNVAEAGGIGAIASSEEFGGRIRALVSRMESGDFQVTPVNCGFCGLRSVCRYREIRKGEGGE